MYCRLLAAAALAAVLFSCSRRPDGHSAERIAVLRFENVGADPSYDWMGRAFAEVIGAEITGAPGIFAIPSSRLHTFNQALGPRPISAPGISAERPLAIVAGANRAVYGTYSVRDGRIDAQFTIEDLRTVRSSAEVSASGNNFFQVAADLARAISDRSSGRFGTATLAALKAWSAAVESADPDQAAELLQQAIAADPDFGPPYRALAEWRARRGDRAGAIAALNAGLARGDRMAAAERARIRVELAGQTGDSAARTAALLSLVKSEPGDPVAWQGFGAASYNGHDYKTAAGAYQKAIEIDPDDVASWNGLGYAAAYAGDLNTATTALRRYQALRPNEANPLDSLGDAYFINGRLREAEGFYLEAAKKAATGMNSLELFKAAMARLMTGEVGGADAIEKQYEQSRAENHDPLGGYHQAEWLWLSGRRKAGFAKLLEMARSAEAGPQRDLTSRAYAELAIWSAQLGDRAGAAQFAQKSITFATQASAAMALVARFLGQPAAGAAEWASRANAAFPSVALKNLSLAYGLLLDREFAAAGNVLRQVHETTAPGGDEGASILLAWCLLETGDAKNAAALLKQNPVPPATGPTPLMSFYFPRLFYLRGELAQRQAKTDEARAQFRLFLTLSGQDPLGWGEEQKAKAGL